MDPRLSTPGDFRSYFEVIDHQARRADDNVCAAVEAGQLHAIGLPAIDRQHVQPRQVRAVAAKRRRRETTERKVTPAGVARE